MTRKADIVSAMASAAGIPNTVAEKALDALVAKAESDLKKTGVFKLTGLGSFKIQARSARKGVNPKTGESIRIKASKRVAFAASKALRDKMRRAPVPGTQK